MRGRHALLVGCVAVVPWSGIAAQDFARPAARTEIYAGSELETYLRNLQVAGVIGSYPWSGRRFTAAEVDHLLPADSSHPWAARYDWTPAPSRGFSLAVVRPEVASRLNSSFPFGYNDGAVWAGRGVTFSAQGGFSLRFGPVSGSFVPLVSWASNGSFPLRPNGQTGALTVRGWQDSLRHRPAAALRRSPLYRRGLGAVDARVRKVGHRDRRVFGERLLGARGRLPRHSRRQRGGNPAHLRRYCCAGRPVARANPGPLLLRSPNPVGVLPADG